MATLAQVEAASSWLRLGPAAGDGWQPVDILATHAEAAIERAAARSGVDDRRIHALTAAYRVGWTIAPALVGLVTSDRLPDLSAPNVVVRDAGKPGAVDDAALRQPGFVCLATDSDADDPSAMVVGDRDLLVARLRTDVTEAWAGRALSAIEAISPVGAKALWGMYASSWASALALAARITGRPTEAMAWAPRLFGLDPRLGLAPPVLYATPDDREEPLRYWRGVCCLYYRVPGYEMCEGSCPLLPEGRAAIRASIAARAEATLS